MINSLNTAQSFASSDLHEIPCPICKVQSDEVVYEATINPESALVASDFNCTNPGHGENFRVVKCRQCQMIYCSPRPSALALIEAYSNVTDTTYVEEEEGRRRTFRRALQKIPQKSGSLLDVGSMSGVFMEEAQKSGFDVYGIEPSAYAAQYAREKKGLRVHTGAIPTQLPWNTLFDIITLWDVIEHVDEPMKFLAELKKLLAPHGELHLSTMDIGSFYARLSGQHWPWLMKMHIYYFSRHSMRKMLEELGFRTIEFYSYSHIVHSSYLRRKLVSLSAPLRLIGKLGEVVLRDKDGFVRVCMGDMMHVRAVL